MARKSADAPPLRFRGLPQRLSLSDAALTGHDHGEILLPPELAAHCGADTLSLSVRDRHGCGPSVRLRLKRTAPAGRYRAELRLAGATLPVELDIAPAPRLRIFPLSADFSGQPGAEAAVEITIANIGNVPFELPARSTAGIFDDDGLELAFVETYRRETDDPAQLLGYWLRALRRGYGGLLKLRIDKGAGMLAPCAEKTFTLRAALPEALQPGHHYHGIWKIGPVHYRLTVAAEKSRARQ